MARLILLNGPPAVGKSTLARLLVQREPLALCLDIDVVRGLLGDWLGRPHEAGLAARSLAVAMAGAHLTSGHDVVVPQYLGRSEFIDELAAVASDAGAEFVEIVLMTDRDEAIAAFTERTTAPTDQTHVDAAALVERSTSADPVGEAWDRLRAVAARRPDARPVEVTRGDVDATFRRLLAAISTPGT